MRMRVRDEANSGCYQIVQYLARMALAMCVAPLRCSMRARLMPASRSNVWPDRDAPYTA